MNNKLVSIIVPCYNQANYLQEALDSVLKQSYEYWECIIVNDGSPDNTEEVALEWCAKDARFRYLYKENGGLVDARNRGIRESIGRWIFPLDSDNCLAPDYLKLAVEVIENNSDIGIVYSRAEYIGDKTGEWILPSYSFEELLKGNMIDSAALFAREDWERVGGYDPKMIYGWEDWEFWINLLSTTGKTVYRLDYIGFYYRVKDISMVTVLSEDNSKMQYSENYVLSKHTMAYVKTFGGYKSLIEERDKWKRKYRNTFGYKLNTFFKSIFRKE